jgi:Protein of unknown function (DUF3306)
MSDSENLLSRWLRLKRESQVALPEADVPSLPAFDPASLPPIESIVADSDIRQFLRANVPPELTHAALRRAWAADPAIRDFIGIAESQWDFNDHAAIPGFGPLQATDYLVAQALGNLSDDAGGTPESPGTVEAPALPSPEPADEVRQDAAAPPLSSHDPLLVEENPGARVAYSHGGALPK